MNIHKKNNLKLSAIRKHPFVIFCAKYKVQLILALILVTHIFLRFYLLKEKSNLTWDQVDSAWAAKSIIVDKHFLINGPVAKGNSGIYMGPIYFYLITIFYFFTNLDPIASPIFQGVLSILNLLVVYIVTKKLFGEKVAIIASIINTFSLVVMNSDRVQSGYYLIVPISYVIFYLLYKAITSKAKYIPYLAIAVGLSFHVDFTSVFYPMLVFLTLPFFLKDRKKIKYLFLSLPLFLLFLLPTIVIDLTTKHSTSNSFWYLFNNYYHGLHPARILQISRDAFISFQQILQFNFFQPFVYLVLPIFITLYYRANPKKQSLILFYLIILWIVIPWVVLSAYSGELTDYYFSLPRDIVIAIIAYITLFLYQRKLFIIKLIPVIFWLAYSVYSLQTFFSYNNGNLIGAESYVKGVIAEKKIVPFKDHSLESYIMYVYKRNNTPISH